jgi:CheY-like chemotaxis protein
MVQVFANLLTNARHALEEQPQPRRVRLTGQADGEWARVEVTDNDPGILDAVRSRVFDPFFTTKPVGMGTGLGLSVCHGIVAKLGGDIKVDSKPGIGTTFSVVLRRGYSRPRNESAPPESRRREIPRNRVLVVDDEVMLAKALGRILAKDYEVVVCSSGRDALTALAGETRFDLVLCDIMMPDLTGMDVYEELSLRAPDMAERIVFMTGGTFTPRARAFLDKVPNPRLDKPIDVRMLRNWIRERLASTG